MRELIKLKKATFLKTAFFMMLMLGLCFLFPVPSYADGTASVPLEMNMSKTGEQDFPSEWNFKLKFRYENGSEITEESVLNALPYDTITWNSSQGTTISRILDMPGYQRTYVVSIFNKDPDNPYANFDQSGWEYDSTKYFLEITDEDGGPKYKIRDENNNVVPKMVFHHKYNRSKTYTGAFSVKLNVKQSTTAVPPSQAFQLEFDNLDLPNQPNPNALEIVDTISSNGVGTVEKVLNVKVNVDDILAADSKWNRPASLPELYTAVFKLKMKNDATQHWEYDNKVHYILFTYNDKTRTFDAGVLAALGNDAILSFAEFTNTYTGQPTAPEPSVEDTTPTVNTISIPVFTKKHIAYIKGYPDATVRPTSNITRAETATMIYRLLTDVRRSEIKTDKNTFHDVESNFWYNESVSSMAKGKYVLGYLDGTFRGENSITRAEFVTMLVRFIQPTKGTKVFSDVDASHWAYDSIGTASAAGWISGYGDGKFGPDKNITRAEVASILNRVMNRGVNEKSTLLNFKNWKDNPAGSWYYYEIIEAGNSHEFTGSRPSENWTKILD